jgi:hypothetical protein
MFFHGLSFTLSYPKRRFAVCFVQKAQDSVQTLIV